MENKLYKEKYGAYSFCVKGSDFILKQGAKTIIKVACKSMSGAFTMLDAWKNEYSFDQINGIDRMLARFAE